MSNCLAIRNTEGRVIGANTPSGQKSELFNAVNSNVYFSNADKSLEMLSQVYTPEIEKLFKDNKNNTYASGEPKIFYKSSNGNIHEDIDAMLIADELGETEVGFRHPETNDFIPVAAFNTEATKFSRFITSAVQHATISSESILGEDGVTRYVGQGFKQGKEVAVTHAQLFKNEARMELGKVAKLHSDEVDSLSGQIELPITDDYVRVWNKDNTTGLIRMEDISTDSNVYENYPELLVASQISKPNRPIEKGSKAPTAKDTDALQQSLMNFLTSMGFEYSDLDAYRERFNTIYGQEPDINAIADLANKVVAVAEGLDVTKELMEEVAHIAIEAYSNQNSIEEALMNVHFTPEYTEFAKEYENKYAQYITDPVKLDTQVRKEILGKILAKSIAKNFDTTTKSEIEAGLINQLKGIWDRVVAFLKGRLLPYHTRQINDLNTRIAQSIIDNQVGKFNNEMSKNFYFDLKEEDGKAIAKELKKAKNNLEVLYKKILKQPLGHATDLAKVMDDMSEVEILSALNAIASNTKKQLENIKLSVKEAQKNKTLLNQKDKSLYEALNHSIFPILIDLQASLKTNKGFSEGNVAFKKSVQELFKTTLELKNDVIGLMKQDHSATVDKLLQDLFDKNPTLTEAQKAEIRLQSQTGLKDINHITASFGLTSDSQNILIQLVNSRVARMTSDATVDFKVKADGIVREVFDNGLDKHQKGIIKNDENGDPTYYYRSLIDYAAYDAAEKALKVEVAAEITKLDKKDIEDKLDAGYEIEDILKSDSHLQEYNEKFKAKSKLLKEQPRSKSYYDQRDAKHLAAGIAEFTKTTLSNISQERAVLQRQFTDKNTGRVDRSKMNQVHLNQEAEFNQRYEAERSSHDQFGNIKPGLRVVPADKLTDADKALLPQAIQDIDAPFRGNIILPAEGLTVEDLEEKARISFDLQNLNLLRFGEEAKKGNVTPEFAAQLEKLEALKDFEGALKFALMNATLTLNDKFYDNTNASPGMVDQLEKHVKALSGEERKHADILLTRYKDAQVAKNTLLKQNRSKKNPLEVDAYNMPTGTKSRILDFETELENIKKEFKKLGFNYDKKAGEKDKSIKTINDALEKELNQFDSATHKVELMQKHMTRKKKTDVDAFIVDLEKKYILEETSNLKKGYQAFVDRMKSEGKFSEKDSAEDIVDILKVEYAKNNVASYYTKFEPIGYKELMDDLRVGNVKASDLVKDKASLQAQHPVLEYLDFNPDYTWLQEVNEEENINPFFDQKGIYSQPSYAQFADKSTFEHYGIDFEEWKKAPEHDLSKLVATKNKEEFRLLQLMVELKKGAIEDYNDTGKVNPYLRPQISKKTAEVVLTGSLKSSWKDLVHNRPDDKEYGEQIEGANAVDLGISIVPKYYQTKLTTGTKDLTENTLTAALMDMQQAILYKHRLEATSDLEALQWGIKNQQFESQGRFGTKIKKLTKDENSVYYKMCKEYLDHHLYGIRQTRNMHVNVGGKEFDITKLISTVQNVFRFSNLAYNPFIDITSATTGLFNTAMDRATQDYYHPSSAKKGISLMNSQLVSYMFETGKVNKTSIGNHLTEYFGLQDIDSKLKNSGLSRTLKFLVESPYKGGKLANVPVSVKILNTILADYRYVKGEDGQPGRFLNWEQFFANRRNQDKTISKTVVEAEFANLINDTLYDNMTVDKNGITFSPNFKEKYGEDAQAEFDRIRATVSHRVRKMAEQADGTLNELDQVAAQRDVVTNTFLLHRGWLPILLSRKFKSKHYSAAFDRFEEGHFISALKMVSGMAKNLKTGKPVLDAYKELENFQKKNIKRISFEVGALGSLILLGMTMFGDDDNEEHGYLYNMAKYINLRTTSEIATQTPFGITAAMVDVMKSPFTSIRLVEAIEPTNLLKDIVTLDGGSILNKLQKNTVLKRVDQFSNLNEKIASYQHFNATTLGLLAPENRKDYMDAFGIED
jgi:hypothetical protein